MTNVVSITASSGEGKLSEPGWIGFELKVKGKRTELLWDCYAAME